MLLAAFVVIEARSAHALMPLRIFASRSRSGAYLIMLILATAMFGTFFLTIFVQDVLGYSALRSGVAFVPFAITIVVVSGNAGQLVAAGPWACLLLRGTFVPGAAAEDSTASALPGDAQPRGAYVACRVTGTSSRPYGPGI